VPNVVAGNINLVARGGSVGTADDDLAIDSGVRDGSHVYGQLYAQADVSVFITESNYELNVLAAQALGGDMRLTVPHTSLLPMMPPGDAAATTQDGEDLFLVPSGSVHIIQGATTTVAPAGQQQVGTVAGGILAAMSISLWVGDNVYAPPTSEITSGTSTTIRGDTRRKRVNGQDVPDANADPGVGTTMDFRGSITPGPGATARPDIFGNTDDDLFLFNQTFLGGQTFAYGSTTPTPAGGTASPSDGQDTFVVNQLQSMTSSRPLVTPDHGITVRRDTLD